ncbi:Golgi-associated kinase 1B-like [Branchiostoma floridae x Branchiostoma japonicum]
MPRKVAVLFLTVAVLGTIVVTFYSYYNGVPSRQILHIFDTLVKNNYSESETMYFHVKYRKAHNTKVGVSETNEPFQEPNQKWTKEASSTPSPTSMLKEKGVSLEKFRNTRYLRFNKAAPSWFSRDDVERLIFLATANISHVLPHPHASLSPIVFDDDRYKTHLISDTEQCESQCGLLKSSLDIYEVLSFHLDRVLGLNRTLPVIARKFRGLSELGYRFQDGKARPLIWWDPDIAHGGKFQNDQNSLELSWVNYTAVLRNRCWADRTTPDPEQFCTPIKHIEWSKLAMFDFLLQVFDRLDRNCCGFNETLETEEEACFTDGRHLECETPEVLMLVHMLTRNSDRTRLVYIDNAGRPFRSRKNLDWRLLQGIDEFPEGPVVLLQDPSRLRRRLLQSLHIDKTFWNSVGTKTILKVVQNVVNRGQLLVKYVDENYIAVVPDY